MNTPRTQSSSDHFPIVGAHSESFKTSPRLQLRCLRNTILAAGICTLVIAQRHAGFMLIFVVLPLVIWLPFVLHEIVVRPQVRTIQSIRIGIWIIALAVIAGNHFRMHTIARRAASAIVATVDSYRQSHGNYPAKIEDIGVTRQTSNEYLGKIIYFNDEKRTVLEYSSTFIPFAMDRYDFRKQIWTQTD